MATASAAPIEVVVITPERQVVHERAHSVVIPAHDGELGVLRGRAPLMCELGIGVLRYRRNGAAQRVVIDGGFAQIGDDVVTVLTDQACTAEEATPERVAATRRELAQRAADGSAAAMNERQRLRQRLAALERARTS
jgi:F-type H+-transporting ATPase subunit epsilon